MTNSRLLFLAAVLPLLEAGVLRPTGQVLSVEPEAPKNELELDIPELAPRPLTRQQRRYMRRKSR